MCLEIIAKIPKDIKTRISAERLSKISGLRVAKARWDNEPALHFSVDGGCSCGFLDGNADWSAKTWILSESKLSSLEKAVSSIGKESKKFYFLVHWLDGEPPIEHLKTNLKSLLKDIRSNQVKNNVMYLIGLNR